MYRQCLHVPIWLLVFYVMLLSLVKTFNVSFQGRFEARRPTLRSHISFILESWKSTCIILWKWFFRKRGKFNNSRQRYILFFFLPRIFPVNIYTSYAQSYDKPISFRVHASHFSLFVQNPPREGIKLNTCISIDFSSTQRNLPYSFTLFDDMWWNNYVFLYFYSKKEMVFFQYLTDSRSQLDDSS